MSHTAWPNLLQRLIRIAEILLSLPARPQRRCALQDDGGKSAPRDGRNGTKGNQSEGFMQRTGYYPTNALPARRARWDAAHGWAEGS
jgi:hypothetical protein